jgi:hypothetical protein
MIIFGNTPTTWKNKVKIWWGNTNKFAIAAFVIYSAILIAI